AREHRLHQPERRKTKTKFVLPDWQQDINEIGVAVVQRMGAAGHAQRASFMVDFGRFAHGARRSTKMVLTKEITGSPFWLTPTVRKLISPTFGRLLDGRNSTTSLLYSMVSPT